MHHAQTSARSVFARDLNAVSAADVIVAYVGAPSSGAPALSSGSRTSGAFPVHSGCVAQKASLRASSQGLLQAPPMRAWSATTTRTTGRRLLAAEIESFVEHRRPTNRLELASASRQLASGLVTPWALACAVLRPDGESQPTGRVGR